MRSIDTSLPTLDASLHIEHRTRADHAGSRRRSRLRLTLLVTVCLASHGAALTFTSPTDAAAPGAISGRVARGTGGAVASAQVHATALDGSATFEASTDATGRYTMQVDSGTYCVSFGTEINDVTATSFNGVRHCLDGVTPVVVGQGATVTDVNGVLHVTEFSGTVASSVGTPVVNGTVYVAQVGGSGRGYGTTGAGGAYTVRNLLPGTYCVYVNDPAGALAPGGFPTCDAGGRRIELLADSPVGGVDFTLGQGPALGSVSGKVTYGGAPVADRPVEAISLDGIGSGRGTTAADGTYTIRSLPAGAYCVRVEIQPGSLGAAEAWDNAENCDSATPVVVVASPVPGIDLKLDEGGTIRGTITSGSAAPLQAADISLRTFGSSSTPWSAQIRSGAGGAYEFAGLPAGDYCLTFVDAYSKHAPEVFSHAPSCSLGATPVRVARGSTTVADAQLDDGGTITGKVIVPTGQDATKVAISARGPLGESSYTQPDAAGNYTLKYLTPGAYCVVFRAAYFSDLVNTEIGRDGPNCTSESGTLEVARGATVRRDVTLELGGSISGWVTTSTGQPIGYPIVEVQPTTGVVGDDQLGELSPGHPDGSFYLRGIPAGTYCVLFRSYEHGVGTTALGDVRSCAAPGAVPVTIASGQHIGGLRITPVVVGYIGGTVRAFDGRDVSGTRVDLIAPGSNVPLATYEVRDDSREDVALRTTEAVALDRDTFSYHGEAPPGTYCVKVTPPAGSGLQPRAYSAALECGQGSTPVTVKATEYTVDIDVTLGPAPTTPTPPTTQGGQDPARVYIPLAEPRRVLDTRVGFATVDGVDAGSGVIAGDGVHEVVVAGRAGVPASAASVVLNVTAVDAAAAGFATVYPCGVERPLASNVNFTAGGTVPNSVIARVGVDGKVCVYSSQRIDAVVDVTGYFPN